MDMYVTSHRVFKVDSQLCLRNDLSGQSTNRPGIVSYTVKPVNKDHLRRHEQLSMQAGDIVLRVALTVEPVLKTTRNR